MNAKFYRMTLAAALAMTILLVVSVAAMAGGAPMPAAWTASDNSKTPAVPGEGLVGMGVIDAPGEYLCAGIDDKMSDVAMAEGGPQLRHFDGLPVAGESALVSVIVKPDGSPFSAGEVFSVTVQNGTDTAAVGFNAYNCNGVTLPADAMAIIDAYRAAHPAPVAAAPAAAAASAAPITATDVITSFAQTSPQFYVKIGATEVTGVFTVTSGGELFMVGCDDACDEYALVNGVVVSTTTGIEMPGQLLKVAILNGPFAEGDIIEITSFDEAGYGVGLYAQSGAGWGYDPTTATLSVVTPTTMATARSMASAYAYESRIEALEARVAALEAKLAQFEEAVNTAFANLGN